MFVIHLFILVIHLYHRVWLHCVVGPQSYSMKTTWMVSLKYRQRRKQTCNITHRMFNCEIVIKLLYIETYNPFTVWWIDGWRYYFQGIFDALAKWCKRNTYNIIKLLSLSFMYRWISVRILYHKMDENYGVLDGIVIYAFSGGIFEGFIFLHVCLI